MSHRISLSFANCLRPAQCFVSNLYVRVLVSEVSDKFSFETFQYGALSFLFSDLSSAELFHQMLTNIPSSMTSTILLSLSRSIFIFCVILQIKFKIFSKIPQTRTGPKHVDTSLPPCWLLLPFDSRSQRSQPLHDSHKANV